MCAVISTGLAVYDSGSDGDSDSDSHSSNEEKHRGKDDSDNDSDAQLKVSLTSEGVEPNTSISEHWIWLNGMYFTLQFLIFMHQYYFVPILLTLFLNNNLCVHT